mmetsp:Transcript_28158/g.77741  ORF Transcript_28158/g.77741 Transcript_28158/m.77741 type:complete len:412 (-) Transcript_28158:42-1277(-)
MFRGELEQVWRRIEEHQRQLDRLRDAQTQLCEENDSLLEALECNVLVGARFSANLHRRRFTKTLRRFPVAPPTDYVRMAQTPGIALAVARFAGLPAMACTAAMARGCREVATSALQTLRRDFQRPKIYIIGGAAANQALDVVERFDPEGSKWTTLAPMPTPRSDLAAAAVGGKLYAIGGYDGRTLSAVELFDPRTNAWEPLAPMPTSRSDFVAAADEHGRVYRLGGLDEYYEALDTVERFDPNTNSWEVLAPMRSPRWSFAVATVAGRLYAIGGFAGGQALGVVECLDPTVGVWEAVSPMPTPRSGFAAATVGGHVYALGGSCPGIGRALNIVERYDTHANVWTRLAPMPTPRSRFSAATVGSRIYTFGGFDDSSVKAALDAVERYDPEADDWMMLPKMPTRRSGAAVLSL